MKSKSSVLESIFKLKEHNTTVKVEILAGISTFVSMCYILFVNPSILGVSGMDESAVFVATALTAIVGCVVMGLLVNYPFAIAPGLGMNAFFSFSVVKGMGMPWQTAMSGVFLAGVLFMIISCFKIREQIVNAIPEGMKLAISGGIGLFIAFIGLQQAGIVVGSESTLVTFGDLASPNTMLSIFGFILIAILMLRKVPGAIFIGMVATVIAGLVTGVIGMPTAIVAPIPDLSPTFGAAITNLVNINDPKIIVVILVFFLVAFFDTAGTMIGLSQQAGLIKDNKLPKAGKALFADSAAMTAGSIFGSTPTSAYIESSVGIAVGGKTGLTAIVVAAFFGLSLFFSPLLAIVTPAVTAPVLIIIGVMIMEVVRGIEWNKLEIAIPAFAIFVGVPLTYNISFGIALGFILYPITYIAVGKRKEISGLMYLLFFVMLLLVYILVKYEA